MEGILLFDKPLLWTSHDAVDLVRRRTRLKAVGHAGTLDPMATGLLVLLVGAATKWSARLSGMDKDYIGSMTLGLSTDTLDLEGRIMAAPVSAPAIGREEIERVFQELCGDQLQAPPAYSALKRGGRKLCDEARRGRVVVADPRAVRVERFHLLAYQDLEAHFTLSCSKGTYVRSLCAEAGERLGCGAALSSLRRTRVGPYRLEEAVSEEQLRSMSAAEIAARLIGMRSA